MRVSVLGWWVLGWSLCSAACGGTVRLGDADNRDGIGTQASGGGGGLPSNIGGKGSSPSSGGSTGLPPTGSGGNNPGPNPLSEACWADSIPHPPQPVPVVNHDVQAACAAAAAADQSEWSATGQKVSSSDAQDIVIGRWQPCDQRVLLPRPHGVFEFGGNRRFRMFGPDDPDTLTPVISGVFYLLGSGQLELRNLPWGSDIRFLSFLPGWQAFRIDGAIYVRIEAAPDNGLSNLPSVSDGACTLTGTWDTLPDDDGSRLGAFSFDDRGNFVVHPADADFCGPTTEYGTYQFAPGQVSSGADGAIEFQITSNVGFDPCDWWFGAGFTPEFENDCTRLTLHRLWDNCTGARGYLNGHPSVLQKR